MKIRLIKTVRPHYTTEIVKNDDLKGYQETKRIPVVGDGWYSIQYEKIKTNIFGKVKRRYWTALFSSDDLSEIREVYDWMVDNNTIGKVTDVIAEDEITE